MTGAPESRPALMLQPELCRRDAAALVRVERALVEALARAIVRELQAGAEQVSRPRRGESDEDES